MQPTIEHYLPEGILFFRVEVVAYKQLVTLNCEVNDLSKVPAFHVDEESDSLGDFLGDVGVISLKADQMHQNLLVLGNVHSLVQAIVDRALFKDLEVFYQRAWLESVHILD